MIEDPSFRFASLPGKNRLKVIPEQKKIFLSINLMLNGRNYVLTGKLIVLLINCSKGPLSSPGEIPHSASLHSGLTGCYGSGRGGEGDFVQQNHLPLPFYDPNDNVIPNEVRDLLSCMLYLRKYVLICVSYIKLSLVAKRGISRSLKKS